MDNAARERRRIAGPGATWSRVGAGAVAGVAAGVVVDAATAGITMTAPTGDRIATLAGVAEAARAHGSLAGSLIVIGYGAIIGALFGGLLHRTWLDELSGLPARPASNRRAA